jgi:RNA polymerase sigma-70 factor (ECF subfamily)
MAKLPPSYRAAFVLHDVEGLDHKEVGSHLGIAEGTSKSLVHKARLRLRRLLRGEVGAAPAGRPPAAVISLADARGER